MFEYLPEDVVETLSQFGTCEFSTTDGERQTFSWPMVANYCPDSGNFALETSIGLPQHALEIEEDSEVTLTFADPTGSGLLNPTTVQIKGRFSTENSEAPFDAFQSYWEETLKRSHHTNGFFNKELLMGKLLDWYNSQLSLFVRPAEITWWRDREASESMTLIFTG